jgi:hypothetical protein
VRTAIATLVVLLAVACGPPRRDSASPDPLPAFYLSGEERGYLSPCGCSRPQLGGLARKATAVAGGLLLESGDLVDGPGRLAELRYETILIALSEMGCRAVNVGDRDLTLGLDFLLSAAGLARFPLLSANIVDGTGALVFDPFIDLAVDADSIRVVGLLGGPAPEGVSLLDPAVALRRVLDSTPPSRRVVLLFHGDRDRARDLLARFPRVEIATYAGAADPTIENPFTAGDRGLRILRLPAGEVVEMTDAFADDPGVARAVETYSRRVEEEDLIHRMNAGAEPEAGGYVGDAACAKCHAESASRHGRILHVRAIDPLVAARRQADPGCVGCHVVGYGERTGFTSVEETPALARVGCESCHGPGRDHTVRPEISTIGSARDACFRCHTDETDPAFVFEAKWAKIRHGE